MTLNKFGWLAAVLFTLCLATPGATLAAPSHAHTMTKPLHHKKDSRKKHRKIAQSQAKTVHYIQGTYCSCVIYAKAVSGKKVGAIGYAKYWPINRKSPTVGSIVIMGYQPYGHVGVVIAVGKHSITITEANFKPCATDTRTLSLSDSHIMGYYA